VKNVLLVDKRLIIQFLSQTHPGTVHDKRIADATPYPLPQGSSLLQDLGFLGFTLDGVLIEMPIKKPKKRALTDEQKRANRARARRRVAIEHVNSSVKRCRIRHQMFVVSHVVAYAITLSKLVVPYITSVFVCIPGFPSPNRNKVYSR
jgi:hypothetical protein